LPSLLGVLRLNKHRELPQRIFELGDVVLLDPSAETGAARKRRLGVAIIHAKANFTEVRALLQGILRDLGIESYRVEAKEDPAFIPGRCASVVLGGKEVAILGEIHPEVLTNFELEYPVAALELDVEALL